MIQHGKEHYYLIDDTYAKQFLDTIYVQTTNNILHKKNNKLGLYSGLLGDLLFCKYYTQLVNKKLQTYETIENEVFNEIFKTINNNESLLIVQFGLTLQILQDEFSSAEYTEQLLKTIDVVLEEYFRKLSISKNYDLFTGNTTYALYFFLRKNESLQDHFLSTLKNDFESKRYKIDEDLRLAHGWVNALLLSLKITKQNNRLKVKFHNLLIDMLEMAQMRVCEKNKLIEFTAYTTSEKIAWCKGMLPICITLENSLQVFPTSFFYIEGRKLAKKIIIDSINYEIPKDACICHGSSSFAMLCNQFAAFDNYDEFIDNVTNHWLKIMFSQLESSKKESLSFFEDYTGLLLGKSGVGLFLMSLIYPSKRKWIELLLLD